MFSISKIRSFLISSVRIFNLFVCNETNQRIKDTFNGTAGNSIFPFGSIKKRINSAVQTRYAFLFSPFSPTPPQSSPLTIYSKEPKSMSGLDGKNGIPPYLGAKEFKSIFVQQNRPTRPLRTIRPQQIILYLPGVGSAFRR